MQIDYSIIPSVNTILENLNYLLKRIDHKYLKQCIENLINQIKQNPLKYKLDKRTKDDLIEFISTQVEKQVDLLTKPVLKRIINGTGVILHTGLGRAPLGKDLLRSFRDYY